MKLPWQNCALVVASVLVVTLLGDGLLWLIAPIQYHTAPVWQPDGHIRGRYRPRQTFRTGPGHNPLLAPLRTTPHVNRINRLGFRGPDYALDPRPGTVRLLVFGGSAAFNFHDAEAETWPQRLGRCLTHRFGVDTEVVNLGLPGFTLGMSKIHYLVNGRALQPDIIVAYHTWNDLKRVGRISVDREQLLVSPVAQPEPMLRRGLRGLSRFSQIIRRARIVYHHLRPRPREGTAVGAADWQPTEHARNWFAANVADFLRFAQVDGVVPVVATQGTLVAAANLTAPAITRHISTDMLGLTVADLLTLWQWANTTILETAATHNALAVDVYGHLPHTLTYLEDHVHLTPAGQTAVAAIVCKAMAESPSIQAVYAHRTETTRAVPAH